MFVCKVSETKVVEVGSSLAKLNIVSHCYERYNPAPHAVRGHPVPHVVQGNLFAMMHARTHADIRRQIEKFVRENGIKKWESLRTERTLKK
jgi:hypothetical protein